MYKKLKSWLLDDTTYTLGLLLLVGIVSFGLGRLSIMTEVPSPTGAEVRLQSGASDAPYVRVSATTTLPSPTVVSGVPAKTGLFVASKSGTKYHRPDCPGAKQIKTENKVFFATVIEASAAGYTPAATCPGL